MKPYCVDLDQLEKVILKCISHVHNLMIQYILSLVYMCLHIGIQPATQLTLLAKNNGVFLETISLGQGQGVKAILTVRLAAERGTWVFLQNCHLAASWMPKLEELYKECVLVFYHAP